MKYDVVQFNENHKWAGCLGIITEVKSCGNNVLRFMVAVPVVGKGTAYIYVSSEENAIEFIGKAILIPKEQEDANK